MQLKVPKYIVGSVDELKRHTDLAVRKKSAPIDFPLNVLDKIDIGLLMTKFSKQSLYMGLAGPQLGILKQVIVFTMLKGECKDSCRRKVWLNPSYENVNDNMIEDYECCVSVKSVTGPVKRYETIHYKTNDIKGNVIEGEVSGTTARLIQHEIDHLSGKLFIDYVPEDKLLSMKEYYNEIIKSHHLKKK